MNEFKGTPGPWVLDGVEIRAADDHPADSPICAMAPGFSRDDAALIAAAPDLLEALYGMLLHIREPESESEFQWPDHFRKQKNAFIAARAAVATALGK